MEIFGVCFTGIERQSDSFAGVPSANAVVPVNWDDPVSVLVTCQHTGATFERNPTMKV